MKEFAVITILMLAAAACAGPRHAQRTKPVAAVRSAPTAARPHLATPLHEDATKAWLDGEIERAPRGEPPAPMVQIVEKPVYVSEPYDPYWNQYSYGGYQTPYYSRYGYRSYHLRSTFPVGTALGAGIGAIIGHQSGHRGRGAWIGSGVGYLFDFGRHW